jgi:hemoglobin
MLRWLLGLTLLTASCATSSSAGAAAPAAHPSATLYERLGGTQGIGTVVDDFLGRVVKDERINARFAFADVPRLRTRLVEMLCQASGGPCTYSGRDMKSVHAGMGIRGSEFDALAGHLVEAMEAAHVSPADQKAVLGVVGPTRADIVEEP